MDVNFIALRSGGSCLRSQAIGTEAPGGERSANPRDLADEDKDGARHGWAQVRIVDRVDVGLARSAAPVPEAFTEARILGQ